MNYQTTGRPVELDIYLPRLKLAIEAQGYQHYQWHPQYGHPQAVQV